MFDRFRKWRNERRQVKEQQRIQQQKIQKENALKIFKHFSYFFNNEIDQDRLSDFFVSIGDPLVAKKVLEHVPVAYNNNSIEFAEKVRDCLNKDKKFKKIYGDLKKSLDNEFDSQILKLKLANIIVFFNNLDKDVKAIKSDLKTNSKFDARKKIASAFGEDLKDVKKNIYFNVSDCCAQFINWFLFTISANAIGTVLEDVCYEYNEEWANGTKEYRKIFDILKQPMIEQVGKDIFAVGADDTERNIAAYVESQNGELTLEKLIGKLNVALDAIGKIRLKEKLLELDRAK